MDLISILDQLKDLTYKIGEYQLQKLNTILKLNTKSSDIDVVSEVDINSERLIIDFIKENFPDHSLISEEHGITDNSSEYRWVIDPLDGTVNYVHGFPIFCISIALQKNEETILGIVHVPYLKETYTAIKGDGAFINDNKISVSSTKDLKHSIIATGFPYDRETSDDNNVNEFNSIITKVSGIRRTGSAAFDLCQVSRGVFDGYWEQKISLWDFAAAMLIVDEANGMFSFNKIGEKYNVIATNENITEEIIQTIGWIDI